MSHGQIARAARLLLAGVVVAVVVLVATGVVSWHSLSGKIAVPTSSAGLQRPTVEIALANRTLRATGFPDRFCEHQIASVRGSAPYVLALADGASKAAAIMAVRNCGGRVIGPLPPNALLVETSVFSLGKLSVDPHFVAAAEWLPEYKIDASLKPLIDSDAATVAVTVVALAPADLNGLVDLAAQNGGERIQGCLNGKSSVTLALPRATVALLAKRGDVRWLEAFVRPKLLNDQAVVPAGMNAQTVWSTYGLTGSGQLVTTSDSGIDTGDIETIHADLRNQLVGFKLAYSKCDAWDKSGHGTHTAGSIVGDGTMSDGQIHGVAYGARLWAWFCGEVRINEKGEDEVAIYTPSNCGDLFRPEGATNAFVHSASWGSDTNGAYDYKCCNIDKYVWEHPDFLPVIANGNAGSAGQTVDTPASAKNVLAVGATQSLRSGNPAAIASFSSRGPCKDGRIKPDVCSPGVSIVSTRSYGANRSVYSSNTNYASMSGTSMATPLTAGAATLVRQWLVQRRGFTNAVPTAALVKAVLTGGAKNALTPNNVYGWGRVDLGESLYPSNRAVRLVDRVPFFDRLDCVACEVTLTNAAPFDVQLVWIDYPGTSGAAKTLINDLDLVVSNKATGATWCGNGVAGGDRTNTVESVRIASAEPGDYAVVVRGVDVSYESTQGGAAAVYVRGAFKGEEESKNELAIVAAEPSDANVTVTAGETNVFRVTVAASTNVSPAFAWIVDGVPITCAQTNWFAYGTTWADRGRHTIRVIVTAPGGLSAVHDWSVAVCGEVHVDAATGDDATATGETDRPYASIAAALEKTVDGDVIRVGAGIYAGGLVAPGKTVRIISMAGPEATVIDGGGTNRCFDASQNPVTVLTGFTLTNGWVNAQNVRGYGAGACYGVLSNCVIVNCHVGGVNAYGGGAAHATLTDCTIRDCCADMVGGGLYDCTARSCLICANGTYYSDSYGGGAVNSILTHCTVFGNESGKAGGVDSDCVCTNSVVWGNTLFNGEKSNWEIYTSNTRTTRTAFSFSCTTPTGYSDCGGNTNAAPRWVNADEGDFRLVVKSPCLGTANDGLNMGAWQGEPVPGCVITATAAGPGEVTPAEIFVSEGESAEFTATMHHPFFGWTTNGIFATGASTNVFIWKDVRTDGVLVASFAQTNFFVDAVCGDDASNGWSWAEAKRTIKAAVDLAREGETVSVNPGVYTGKVNATEAKIDIVAVSGPKATVIAGDGSNRCYVGYYNAGTTLRGFTLEGGVSAENYGGGVFHGTLSNCVIRNCRAGKGGGGVYIATLTDCIVTDCMADYGGGVYGSSLTNCVIANCSSAKHGGGASDSYLENCTVRGNRTTTYYRDPRATFAGGGVDYGCTGLNTILWDNIGPEGSSDDFESIWRYDWYKGWSVYEPQLDWCCSPVVSWNGSNCLTNNPWFVSADAADVSLYEISPCLATGKDGVNIGAYRGKGVVRGLPTINVKTAEGGEVSNAVASVGFVDKAVEKGIGTNGATYAAFQSWSTNGLKSTAVAFSSRAYDSFLVRGIVAAPTLLGEGKETKVELTALEPEVDGTCSTTLRLVDGENAIPLCSVKAAFAKHMKVGDDVTALAPADAANVEVTSVDEGRAVKLTITPPALTSCYFMWFSISR